MLHPNGPVQYIFQLIDEHRVDQIDDEGTVAHALQGFFQRIAAALDHHAEKEYGSNGVDQPRQTQLLKVVHGAFIGHLPFKGPAVKKPGVEPGAGGKEHRQQGLPLGDQLLEAVIMPGNHPAQHKDEQIEKREIVQPVIAQIQQGRAGSNPFRIGPEPGISLKQQHLGGKEQRQCQLQADFFHSSHQGPPQREQQVEPDQDHQEIDVVLSRAEEQGKQDIGRIQDAHVPVQKGVVAQIQQGRQQVGTADAFHPFLHKAPIPEGLLQRLAVEQPVAGDEKEGRYAVAAQDVGDEHQKRGSHDVADRHAPHMDGNDPQHADAPEVVEYKIALFHRKLLCRFTGIWFRRSSPCGFRMNLSYLL